MTNKLCLLALAATLLTSCHTINTVLKSNDREYKFEVAKRMYAEGKYGNAYIVLDNILPSMRNTKPGDEALFLAGMCKYYSQDYDAASEIFKRYYNRSYPLGQFVDEARYYSALAYYESTYPARLDQSGTYDAMREIQNAMEQNPDSKYYDALKDMLFQLQERLVEKEYLAAKLYFDLGDYFLNCLQGGSNYEACVVTAQNAIREYPYSPRKEDFAILVLRAKFELAQSSVESKKFERYTDTVDEYYGFINEFPQSRFLNDAKQIYEKSEKELRSQHLQKYNPDDSI